MARITIEDCLKNVDNRFALIHLAAKRVRQLRKGSEPLVSSKNKDIVVALREIAAGKVFKVKREEEPPMIMEGLPQAMAALSEPAEQASPPVEEADVESAPEDGSGDA